MRSIKKITVVETFAGIGAQHKALELLRKTKNFDYEVIATSEWDIDAIIAYASIHHDLKNKKWQIETNNQKFATNMQVIFDKNFPSNGEIVDISNYLLANPHFRFNLSNNGSTPTTLTSWKSLIKNQAKLKLLLMSLNLNKNIGSIIDLKLERFLRFSNNRQVDIFTYSFPCTDLSAAASIHGFNRGMSKGSQTRSGLLWEVEKLLKKLFVHGNQELLNDFSKLIGETSEEINELRKIIDDVGHNVDKTLKFEIVEREKEEYFQKLKIKNVTISKYETFAELRNDHNNKVDYLNKPEVAQFDHIVSKKEVTFNTNFLPKVLLLENVVNMVSKKHIQDFQSWLTFLKLIGYEIQAEDYYIVDARNHGIPQTRKRVFSVAILKSELENFNFPKISIENRYEKSKVELNHNDIVTSKAINEGEWSDYWEKYPLQSYLDQKRIDEIYSAIPNDTKSRRQMFSKPYMCKESNFTKGNPRLSDPSTKWCRTITTKQDRQPNSGMVDINPITVAKEYDMTNKLQGRFLTPRETYKLMGFKDQDFDNVKWHSQFVKKEKQYKQAGNSIVVNALISIFDGIIK